MSRRYVFLMVMVLLSLALLPGTAHSQTDAYSNGMALFQQQRYTEALPFFQQASSSEPNKSLLLYYLAYCQEKTGDLKDAVLNFYRVDGMKASPSIRAHADKEKDKLSLEDQAWLEEALKPKPTPTPGANLQGAANPSMPAPPEQTTVSPAPSLGSNAPPVFLSKNFGLRLNFGFDFWNMPDLDAEERGLFDFAQSEKTKFPGTAFDKTVPMGGLFVEAGAFAALEDVEVGAKMDYYFTNRYDYKVTDSNYTPYFDEQAVDFDSFGGSAFGRFYFKADPTSRFYLEPSVGLQTLHLNLSIAYAGTSGNPSAASYGYTVDGTTLSGGMMMGFDFLVGKHFLFSFGGGYNYAKFTDLQGRFGDGSFPNRDNLPGKAVTERVPSTGERFLWFLPDDANQDYLFYPSSPANYDVRPLVIDFSALRFTMDFSFVF